MSAPETLPKHREQELRDLHQRWKELQSALERYRGAAAIYKNAEKTVLDHYPACARPGPFVVNGTIIECRDRHDDSEWRFDFTDAVVIP